LLWPVAGAAVDVPPLFTLFTFFTLTGAATLTTLPLASVVVVALAFLSFLTRAGFAPSPTAVVASAAILVLLLFATGIA
jgi:hypothetical protein